MGAESLENLEVVSPSEGRVVSVDVLRGFDMFWIVGGAGIIETFHDFGSNRVTAFLANQLRHRDWAGFAFEDFIFPLFVFLVGMAVVFSVGKIVQREGKTGAYRRIFRRFAIMFALGVVCSSNFLHGLDGVRVMGVLQRLSLCYLATALLFCHLKPKHMMAVCAALLIGYWAWLSFVPVPGLGKVSFSKGANWSNYIDSRCLPFHKYDGTWDPEGLLSTLPAIATCILGVFAGLFLKNANVPASKKGLYLIGVGILGICAGYLWGVQFPIIKKIWTSSYVILAGGYSCVALGLFYQVIDIWKIRRWTTPFLWIGSNALAIYIVGDMIRFDSIARLIVGESIFNQRGGLGSMSKTIVNLGCVLLIAGLLHRKKIFIRI